MARLLALDLGERRIGVAVSDPTGMLARPLTTVVRASREDDFEAISYLIEEHAAKGVIIGLPLSLNGTEGPQARRIRRYAERLAKALDVPIQFWDERYSSVEAAEILSEKRGRPARARGELDAMAAAIILQSYLDAQTPTAEG
jgi:putative Holliday junction resolvase